MAYEGYTALGVALEQRVATVTIDNPPINLFDLTLYLEMARVAEELAADEGARVVVLRSANPDFFIAHFDVGLILQIPTDLPPPTELNAFHGMCECFRTMPKPTIAVIEGRVGGGGSELTLSCDLRFAAIGKAVFSQPEVALGILPGGSGTVRLSRLIGRSRALEVVLGCGDVDADLAERWVLRADKEIEADLLAEAAAFNRTLADPEAQAAMRRFLEIGGQTRDGELRLPELLAQLRLPVQP